MLPSHHRHRVGSRCWEVGITAFLALERRVCGGTRGLDHTPKESSIRWGGASEEMNLERPWGCAEEAWPQILGVLCASANCW